MLELFRHLTLKDSLSCSLIVLRHLNIVLEWFFLSGLAPEQGEVKTTFVPAMS